MSIDDRIGVGADDRPLPNGASGVFIRQGTQATMIGNLSHIAYNADFGVAIERGVTNAVVGGNVENNGNFDIDWGLDGPTPNDMDNADGVPNSPVIQDAVYDPATNTTTITGEMHAPVDRFGNLFVASVYAGEPLGDSGRIGSPRFVGGAYFPELYPPVTRLDRSFTVAAEGDLRGKSVAARATSQWWADGFVIATSELSAPVPVR